MSLGLGVRGVGVCSRDFRYAQPIEGRLFPGWVVIHVSHGRGYYQVADGPRQEASAGSSFLITPNQRHSYGVVAGEPWEELWIWLNGPRIDELAADGLLADTLTYWPSDPAGWLRGALESALAIARIGDAQGLRRLPGLGHQVLDAIIPAAQESPSMPRHQAQVCDAVRAHIRAHLGEHLDFRAVAAAQGVSYASLRLRFRQRFGLGLVQYHNRERIQRAGQLLLYGATVADAARAVGIADPAYFSRLFRQLTGSSPRDYRRRAQ